MDLLSRAVTLRRGVTITVQAWPYLHFSANFMDYRHLLKAFRERAVFEEDGDLPQQALIDRVVLSSVPRAEDRAVLAAADLPELLDAILVLNNLEEVAAKPLGLYMRLLQAETVTLEAPTAAPPTTSPT